MTIKLFVGCGANGEDVEAQAMFEYSLYKHISGPVEVTWMKLSKDPASPWYSNPKKREGWNTEGWATPFSAFRWAIPHVCNFEGKAIYMDGVDMIVKDDLYKLWNQEIPAGKCILTKNESQTCVILFDCAACKQHFPNFDYLRQTPGFYRNVRRNIGVHAGHFQGNWNCLDGEKYASLDDPDIKILHFTKVESQPHLKWALPRLHAQGQKHWGEHARPIGLKHDRKEIAPMVEKLWAEAQAAGYTADKYMPKPEEAFGKYNSVRGGAKVA